MEGGDRGPANDDSNFFNTYRAEEVPNADDEVVDSLPHPEFRPGEQCLPGSWEKPLCQECGKEDGPVGGGRYGFDDHEGSFFCGRCWKAWDLAEQEKIMKPAYLQTLAWQPLDRGGEDPQAGNFFDVYRGGDGTDDAEGAWDPKSELVRGEGYRGEMALPASWERPTCHDCGMEEGEDGGGRYRRDEAGDLFFCGRCWKSWDADARRKIMMGYAPACLTDSMCSAPDVRIEPVVDCPAPDAPNFDDEEWEVGDAGKESFEGAEVDEWDGESELGVHGGACNDEVSDQGAGPDAPQEEATIELLPTPLACEVPSAQRGPDDKPHPWGGAGGEGGSWYGSQPRDGGDGGWLGGGHGSSWYGQHGGSTHSAYIGSHWGISSGGGQSCGSLGGERGGYPYQPAAASGSQPQHSDEQTKRSAVRGTRSL